MNNLNDIYVKLEEKYEIEWNDKEKNHLFYIFQIIEKNTKFMLMKCMWGYQKIKDYSNLNIGKI